MKFQRRMHAWRNPGCAVIATAALAAGCTSLDTVPLGSHPTVHLNGKTIVLARREPVALTSLTTGKMLVAAFTGATIGPGLAGPSMRREGQQVQSQYHLVEPGPGIGESLLNDFAGTYHMSPQATSVITTATRPAELAQQYAGADFVLDLHPLGWVVGVLPTGRHAYGVRYVATITLVDGHSGATVAEAPCYATTKPADAASSYEVLMLDDAALLKRQSGVVAADCLTQLRLKLGLRLPVSR